MPKQVIIGGAGPGGLVAAMLLAASGVRVKVVERLPHVGGRTSSIEADGFRFDLGPTFFLYPRVLEEIFSAAGRDMPMVMMSGYIAADTLDQQGAAPKARRSPTRGVQRVREAAAA